MVQNSRLFQFSPHGKAKYFDQKKVASFVKQHHAICPMFAGRLLLEVLIASEVRSVIDCSEAQP